MSRPFGIAHTPRRSTYSTTKMQTFELVLYMPASRQYPSVLYDLLPTYITNVFEKKKAKWQVKFPHANHHYDLTAANITPPLPIFSRAKSVQVHSLSDLIPFLYSATNNTLP